MPPPGTGTYVPSRRLGWVWSALPPSERRRRLVELREWVEWLVGEYPEDCLAKIPPCWYAHPGIRNRLTALYVAWIRVYVESTDKQGAMALTGWHEALDKSLAKVSVPSRCVTEGVHDRPARRGWRTDSSFDSWVVSGTETTRGPVHPAAQFIAPRQGGQQPAPPPGIDNLMLGQQDETGAEDGDDTSRPA